MRYDPLPLTGEDSRSNALYNAPPSPDPFLSTFQTPEMRAHDFSNSETALPPGAAPRFLGPALYDDPALRPRDSFASSSFQTAGSQPASVYTSSVYALNEQNPRFDGRYRDDPNDTLENSDPNAVLMSPIGRSKMLEEKRAVYAAPVAKSRKKMIILATLAGLVIVILAVMIPIYFTLIRPKSKAEPSQDHDNNNKPTPNNPNKPENRIVTGGDGSEVTMEDGTKFIYHNPFGGYWYYDEEDPFNNGARAQSWSPALNETFHYGTDKMRG
jgi:glucan 1,3-beta-glucosidase